MIKAGDGRARPPHRGHHARPGPRGSHHRLMPGPPSCITGGTFHDVCAFPREDSDAFAGYSSTSVLLPLVHSDGFRPRVMICGGFSNSPWVTPGVAVRDGAANYCNYSITSSAADQPPLSGPGGMLSLWWRAHLPSRRLPVGNALIRGPAVG